MEKRVYVSMLKQEFGSRLKSNPLYSLRAFARDLELSPASLSLIFHQKKGLSLKKAKVVCEKIGWSRKESALFMKSVEANHSRTEEKRSQAQVHMEIMKKRNVLSSKTLHALRSWDTLALLELMELPGCEHKAEWFARKLKINKTAVELSLQALIENGLVEFIDNRYRPVNQESTTDFDIPSDSIKSFHSQLLRRAEESLHMQSPASREFISMTLAFSKEDTNPAKEMIRQFQEAFAEKFYVANKKQKNSVYTLNIQLFQLDDGA